MCCILCEEPVRSITLGLAAAGIVTVVRGARRLLSNGQQSEGSAANEQVAACAVVSADVAQ
jgi:hypothetical protein